MPAPTGNYGRKHARGYGRKYGRILAIALQDRWAYRSDVFAQWLASAFKVFIAYLLWRTVFAGRDALGGLSLDMVVAYYIIATFLATLDGSEGYTWELAAEIRSGRFGKYLVRPVDPLGYFLAVSAGRTAFQACSLLIAACTVTLFQGVSGIVLVSPPAGASALWMIPVLALGLCALALLNFSTAILAMRFQDITPFHMIKNDLVAFLSGALVPLALMPPWVRGLIGFTPFPALASLPAELWLGRGAETLPRAFAVLVCWNLLFFLLARSSLAVLVPRYQEAGA